MSWENKILNFKPWLKGEAGKRENVWLQLWESIPHAQRRLSISEVFKEVVLSVWEEGWKGWG